MRAHCIRREKTNFLGAAHGLRGARLGTVAERKIEYESERKKDRRRRSAHGPGGGIAAAGSFIKFGTVSISLVLVPIVVGAALYGVGAGAWLGGVFSVVVLCQPDTALFLNMSIFGTILTVMLKGILAGALSGLVYRVLSKKHK